MKTALMFVIAAGLSLPGDAKEDAIKKERDKLQGEWVVTGAQKGGKKLSEDERRKLSDYFLVKLNIKDDQVQFTMSEKGAEPKAGEFASYELDPTKSPKTFRFPNTTAIYAVEGDTLKACFNEVTDGEVPSSFDTAKNESAYLFEFKRAAKK